MERPVVRVLGGNLDDGLAARKAHHHEARDVDGLARRRREDERARVDRGDLAHDERARVTEEGEGGVTAGAVLTPGRSGPTKPRPSAFWSCSTELMGGVVAEGLHDPVVQAAGADGIELGFAAREALERVGHDLDAGVARVVRAGGRARARVDGRLVGVPAATAVEGESLL